MASSVHGGDPGVGDRFVVLEHVAMARSRPESIEAAVESGPQCHTHSTSVGRWRVRSVRPIEMPPDPVDPSDDWLGDKLDRAC